MWDSVFKLNINAIIKIIYSNHLDDVCVDGRITLR